MPATLKQVAERAGCAISTASNVINGKQRLFPISDETRSRILSAADELGFRPNRIAKSLRRQRSETIGCVFAAKLCLVNDPVLGDLLSGVGAALDARGYDMVLYSGYDDIARRVVEAAQSRAVDGLLYVVFTSTYAQYHGGLADELAALDVPVVGMQLFAQHGPGRAVGLDAEGAGALAVEHLHGLGHDAIGFIATSPQRMIATQELNAGFRAAGERVGLTRMRCHHVEDVGLGGRTGLAAPDHYRIGRLFADRIIARDELLPAYVVASDLAAAGFRDGLREHGIEVPRDVAIVGMGNILHEARGSSFFTTVDTKRHEIGRRAAEILVDAVERRDSAEGDRFVAIAPELVVRESCGARQGRDRGQAP